jgi:hypothetical protein
MAVKTEEKIDYLFESESDIEVDSLTYLVVKDLKDRRYLAT